MAEGKFTEPRLALNRIYTRGGDRGETALAGGQRVAKDAPRIEAYGTVDELNAWIGMARLTAQETPALSHLAEILLRVQHELFNLGSMLATLPEDLHPKQARVTQREIEVLEAEIDEMNRDLPPLRSFVLPGGCRINAEIHVCRTVCRRAERATVTLVQAEGEPEDAVRYLNRLSDALFVWSRWASRALNANEVLWRPNESASGKAGD